MERNYNAQIAAQLNVRPGQVEAAVRLLEDGATVPFITRYRKEATDNLDEVALTTIRDRLSQLKELDKRREAVLQSIQDQGKLTEDLKQKILAAPTMAVLEDIYLPYRPKRRTKATIAKEKGLEPLARIVFDQNGVDPQKEALKFVSAERAVASTDEALAGARDIIAEWINEDASLRAQLRNLFKEKGIISSRVIRGKEEEGQKYKDYFQWEEPARSAPSHRILAARRGEREKFLMVRVQPPEEEALDLLETAVVKSANADSRHVRAAVQDSYKRLLSLSLETEIRLEIKKRADLEAIRVFDNNLRELLMAPPLGRKRVLAIDPGLRTGCKVVCLDEQGALLANDTVYLVQSGGAKEQAVQILKTLCEKYAVEVIAIGNGTAGRETEAFVRAVGLPKSVEVIMVNESGASIYSVSEAAREEFPGYDATVRGAISIGRRLMDPLAELVKIDPKSIGVGQYQHDVDQNLLKGSLDDTVISCVNQVGVEVNTASKQLLTYVSGIGPVRAQAMIEYRNVAGPFRSRDQILSVPGFGPKAFEQAAGFLRIRDGDNPLDASAVHPESYPVVTAMAVELKCSVPDILGQANLRKKIDLGKFVSGTVGLPTLMDIVAELARPGRDPRSVFEVFSFKEGVAGLEDLSPGMTLPGIVTNVTAFGAFVDVGVHQDGLVHISQLADRFIKDPSEAVKIGQRVTVTVLEVDAQRRRIALSMRKKG